MGLGLGALATCGHDIPYALGDDVDFEEEWPLSRGMHLTKIKECPGHIRGPPILGQSLLVSSALSALMLPQCGVNAALAALEISTTSNISSPKPYSSWWRRSSCIHRSLEEPAHALTHGEDCYPKKSKTRPSKKLHKRPLTSLSTCHGYPHRRHSLVPPSRERERY